MEPYTNRQFGFIDNPDRQSGSCSVPTRTRTRSDGPDPLLTLWVSIPPYHNLTPNDQSYEEVSQWNGKEMKKKSQYLLGVVTQSLTGGIPTQRSIFNHVIECKRSFLELYMYARYKCHDDATLCYMAGTIRPFHTFKDVSLLGRAGKKPNSKANPMQPELVLKRKVDGEINDATRTPSQKRHQMTAWREDMRHEIDFCKELDAHFNFPQIQLMSHWFTQTHRSGDLQ